MILFGWSTNTLISLDISMDVFGVFAHIKGIVFVFSTPVLGGCLEMVDACLVEGTIDV